MLTAEVAKKTLSPTTLKCVTKAIQNDYYPDYADFITASLWSDHIKASPPPFGLDYTGGTRAYNEWHFIDFPYSSSSSYTCDTKKEENVVKQSVLLRFRLHMLENRWFSYVSAGALVHILKLALKLSVFFFFRFVFEYSIFRSNLIMFLLLILYERKNLFSVTSMKDVYTVPPNRLFSCFLAGWTACPKVFPIFRRSIFSPLVSNWLILSLILLYL